MLSKGLTAGFLPLSAVLTTDAIYALFDADYGARRAFLHSNTYTGNALAVAVANAALDVYAERGHPGPGGGARAAPARGAGGPWRARRPYLARCARAAWWRRSTARPRRGARSIRARRTGYRVYREAVRRGALLRPLGDTMYLFPPLTVSDDEVSEMTAILAQSLDAVVGAP